MQQQHNIVQLEKMTSVRDRENNIINEGKQL